MYFAGTFPHRYPQVVHTVTLGRVSGPEPEPVPFEDLVAALLQVDPEGIVGQKAGKAKKADSDKGDDAD